MNHKYNNKQKEGHSNKATPHKVGTTNVGLSYVLTLSSLLSKYHYHKIIGS